MATKPAKRKNPADATLRNVRATRAQIRRVTGRLDSLQRLVKECLDRLARVERRVERGGW
jgi:hypothetical protein